MCVDTFVPLSIFNPAHIYLKIKIFKKLGRDDD